MTTRESTDYVMVLGNFISTDAFYWVATKSQVLCWMWGLRGEQGRPGPSSSGTHILAEGEKINALNKNIK